MRSITILTLLLTILIEAIAQTVIPGTHCSLTPPKGFTPATSFTGYQSQEQGSSIIVAEIPTHIDKVLVGITSEALNKQGMTLQGIDTLSWNDGIAYLFHHTQKANGIQYKKQMLAFGEGSNTILVNAIYPANLKGKEDEMREALLSTQYHQDVETDPFSTATCTIQTEGTDFKPIKYVAGSLIYSTDTKIPTDQPIIIVGNSLGDVPITDQRAFSTERLKKLPNCADASIKATSPVKIDGLTGYAITAMGKTKTGQDELTYQVTLFPEGGGYYLIVAQAKDSADQFLQTFRTLATTFRRK